MGGDEGGKADSDVNDGAFDEWDFLFIITSPNPKPARATTSKSQSIVVKPNGCRLLPENGLPAVFIVRVVLTSGDHVPLLSSTLK